MVIRNELAAYMGLNFEVAYSTIVLCIYDKHPAGIEP